MILGKGTELPLQVMRKQVVRTVIIVVVAFGLISVVIVSNLGDSLFAGSYFLGALLGVANGAVGFVTIEKYIDKRTILFIKGVFLGMGIRLVLLLGVFIFLMLVIHVNIEGFVWGLFVFYFTMTALEIVFINKRLGLMKVMMEKKR